jgi:hypothetical protein
MFSAIEVKSQGIGDCRMARVALKDKPITGPYPELASLVREILGPMSARVAQRKTGVNFLTISNMAQGDRGSFESIVKFAQAFQRDPNPLLRAASLPELNPTAEYPQTAATGDLVREGQEVIVAEGVTVRLILTTAPDKTVEVTRELLEAWLAAAEADE